MPDREWRPVVGWEGLYEVSSCGAVRGAKRQGTSGAELRPHTSMGYPKVHLYRGCVRRAVAVHRLVLEAFERPCGKGEVACHYDGDKTNNHIANLRWDTPAANYDDARRHGTAAIGERNPATKLSQNERRAIFSRRADGALQREIAAEFGICQQHVSAILKETESA